ncbi:MAG: sigma-70 family RNA polymerase sigma factor [Planctomycetes bacterium]|nr:sigma-70 family RNA polymerase sigma factor [Planctomycetota bacterium]
MSTDRAPDCPPCQVDPEQSLRELIARTMPELRAFVRRLCGNQHDADDVLQDALTKAWRLRAGFDPTQNGVAWLQRAAFHSFCDLRQRLRRAPSASAAALDVDAAPAPPAACAAELRDELGQRLLRLDELARTLLLGFHRDGRSLRELARDHRLPLNTVKSHLHRARRELRSHHEHP